MPRAPKATKSAKAVDPDVAAVERAMVRIRRSVSRRAFGRALAERAAHDVDLTHVPVVDAVEEGPADDGEPVTVGLVARRLAMDASRASRVVAAAVAAGFVSRVASPSDSRRVGLELTSAGRALLRTVRTHRASWFEDAMDGWSAADRKRFAELLTRFVDTLTGE